MFEKLEICHLRLLREIYATGTVSAAAEALNISQQAASLQLKKIRTILGDPVFQRSGHGVVATAYGQQIRGHIDQLFALISSMPKPSDEPLESMVRSLSISATDYTQLILVDPLFRQLRVRAPQVKLKLSNIESFNLNRRLQTGELDIAFTSSGYVPEGLMSTPLFTEKYVCVAAQALANNAAPLAISALAQHDFLVVSPGVASFDGSASSWFAQQGLKRNVVATVPSFWMAQAYLRQSDLVAFIPSRLMPSAGLVEIPLQKYPPGFQVVAAYHGAMSGDPLLTWVLDIARALPGNASSVCL
ncbi:LysR family transcriptional regulator [Pseudoduganella danionis]|uniref:LysR family transcriptional regulator n=1 Tax=Pseudoduganella danionis TaxID=1890295 RepID=UPI0035ADC899